MFSNNLEPFDHARAFSGVEKVYGGQGVARLQQARISVVGLGGVGSWTVEALVRTGVGSLQIIDLDHIAESNRNRQIHALSSTIGQAKGLALQQRILEINPECLVDFVDDFISAENIEDIWKNPPDIVIDCTDDVAAKVAMILFAQQRKIPVLVCGGAGGKENLLRLQQSDLAHVQNDPLLAKVRSILRRDYAFPKGKQKGKAAKMGVECIWLDEPTRHPDWHNRSEAHAGARLACAGYGSLITVTASMGLAVAQAALRNITSI